MHSKHHPFAHHTMAKTYKPHYSTSYPYLSTRQPTWSETQAAMILSLRDITNPPKIPDVDVEALEPDRQIHARWTDPDLVSALSRLHESLPPKTKLSFRYGGRDVTAATWVMVYQISPNGITELRYVLWFHEYDNLDVEVGELAGVEWSVEKDVEVAELAGVEWDVEMEDVEGLKEVKGDGVMEMDLKMCVDRDVKVKIENIDLGE